jgi:hypothetical protein
MNSMVWAGSLIGALLLLCLSSSVIAKPLTNETLSHGPFEIVAAGRRISSGGFATGGGLFSTMEVTSFSVRWQGKEVMIGGHSRFWRVLRLPDATRPALLLATSHFRLIYEDQGQLVVKDFGATSGGMAYTQWLDQQQGQPGESAMYGVEKVSMATGTTLQGGPLVAAERPHGDRCANARHLHVQALGRARPAAGGRQCRHQRDGLGILPPGIRSSWPAAAWIHCLERTGAHPRWW